MFNRLKQALVKASQLFSKTRGVQEDDIEEILLQADIGVKYTAVIIDAIRRRKGDVLSALKEEIVRLLSMSKPQVGDDKPRIIMVCGVNGSGKTTTVAKLAQFYKRNDTILLVCGDTYRDAASEQLVIWATRTNVEVLASQKGQDAGAVVFDALEKARAKSIDTLIIDTAGRLHTRDDLMQEQKKIIRIVRKFRINGPHLNLLTIDASLGQNSIQQARVFKKEVEVNGLILTKVDGSAKGGAVIPICNELNLPILFLGIGEGMDDITEFDARTFVEALFS